MPVYKLPGTAIQANTITTTQLQTTVVTQIQAGASGGPKVKSLIYPGDDTAANSTGGQTLYITGSGFAANAQVLVNGSAVPSQSFISASNISFTTPALSTGTYPVYVINPEDGGTAILYPGLLISGEPAWVTSAGSLSSSQDEGSVWSYSLSATGDTPITYALAAGNTLPAGISLAANGLISGTISSPTGNVTTYTFSVVATDVQNQESTRQFTVTTSTGEGGLFANNVLLIHADGTNNGNNHQFLDSSNNNFTITRNGNATQGSFSPFSQTGWSNYFDGTGDYLSLPSNANFAMGTGDFTIEFWAYWNAVSSTIPGNVCHCVDTGTLVVYITNTVFSLARYNVGGDLTATVNQTVGRWDHYAVTRQSGTMRLFKNGELLTSGSVSTNYAQNGFQIGLGASSAVNGYISNLRLVKGTAVYTSTFTPPTSPLTAIANTSLLTCQSNRFIDNSTNAFTITRNGDVSVQPFSPLAPAAVYSTANVGGSGYFDGTGDYLTSPGGGNLGSGDFTVQFWINPSVQANYATVFGTRQGTSWYTGEWSVDLNTSGINFVFATYATGSTSVTLPNFAWTHIAFVRSGSTFKTYRNGVLAATNTNSDDYTTTAIGIGNNRNGNASPFYTGYLADLQLIPGTALYSADFIPPALPATTITNNSLLLKFTNAQIFDQTAKNVLECVGDAKVSTAQYKYGTASMYFDGNGDYLFIPSSVVNTIGDGDFTVECWVRPTTFSNWNGIVGIGTSAASRFAIRTNSSGNVDCWLNGPGNTVTSNTALVANTWSHIAAVRSGSGSNNVKLYINGNLTAQATSTYSIPQYQIVVGRTYDAYDGEYYNGYMDDFRITKGYARYTSNFTPPASAMKDK